MWGLDLIAGCGYALGRETMPFILKTCTHAQELCSKIVFSVFCFMDLCIIHMLCFFLECREDRTLKRKRERPKGAGKRSHLNFPYWQRKHFFVTFHTKYCVVFTFSKTMASCLALIYTADFCCRLWAFVPVISDCDGELGLCWKSVKYLLQLCRNWWLHFHQA